MDRSQRYVRAIGRLKPGVSLGQARAGMTAVASALAKTYPATNDGWTVKLSPVVEQLLIGYRAAFGALLGAVGVLLLMACVNIASVFLARNTTRRHELALRAALGAGRRRLARQVLSESMLIALLGGLAGLFLARAGTQALSTMMPQYTPRIGEVRVDLPVLLFAAFAAALSGVLCGLLPSLRSAATAPGDALRAQSRTIVGLSRHGLQSLLVVAEVALSIVLLVGGGLVVRSFAALLQRGISGSGGPPAHAAPHSAVRALWRRRDTVAAFRNVLEQIARLPEVQAAGAVTGYPDSSLGILGMPAVVPTR